MTPSPRSPAAEEGVTNARTQRVLPPTAEEVGRAAALCFWDVASDEQIAAQLGIVRRTLARWKRRPEFVAATAALRAWQELTHDADEDLVARRVRAQAARARRRVPRTRPRTRKPVA